MIDGDNVFFSYLNWPRSADPNQRMMQTGRIPLQHAYMRTRRARIAKIANFDTNSATRVPGQGRRQVRGRFSTIRLALIAVRVAGTVTATFRLSR